MVAALDPLAWDDAPELPTRPRRVRVRLETIEARRTREIGELFAEAQALVPVDMARQGLRVVRRRELQAVPECRVSQRRHR